MKTGEKNAALRAVEPLLVMRSLPWCCLGPVLLWILTATDVRHHAAVRVHAAGGEGRGGVLAVLDTGLDADQGGSGAPHATFLAADGQTRLLANLQLGRQPAEDQLGHGTAVAATAAGERWNAAPTTGRGHAPAAALRGYSVADEPSGLSDDATLVAAWQAVLRDRVVADIGVACNAYAGSPDPTHPVQQALDACAWAGDVLVVVAAGNSADPRNSQAARNGLAVGAVAADKRLAAFSARGPLPGLPGVSYPDLVAHGVAVQVPVPDDPAVTTAMTGTSCAAAQVAGAAVLLRARWPHLSALQARAVLLASTEGVAARQAPDAVAGLGAGYLRDDLALSLPAAGSVRTLTLTADPGPPPWVCELPAGQPAVAVALWPRTRLTSATASVVELRVTEGSVVLWQGQSVGGQCLRAGFTPRTGRVLVTVRGVTLDAPALDVALVVGTAGPDYQPARSSTVALGCPGSATAPAGSVVFPPQLARAFGNAATVAPVALWPSRCQQVLAGSLPAGELVALAFRPDEASSGQTGCAVDLELSLARCDHDPQALRPRFADNVVPGSAVVAVARRWLRLPDPPDPPDPDPESFPLLLPFDRPVALDLPAGAALVCETRVFGNDQGNRLVPWWVDAGDGVAGARVLGSSPTAETGEVRAGFVAPVALLRRGTTRLVPQVASAGLCERGGDCPLALTRAAPRQPGLWLLGTEPLQLQYAGCTLGLLPEVMLALRTDDLGGARLLCPLPLAPGPVLRVQAVVVDVAAGGLGLVLSDRLDLLPGFLP